MIRDLSYPATLENDEDGRVVVTFRDLVGAQTDGADRLEALDEAQDCLREAVAATLRHKEPLPEASPPQPGEVMVPLPLPMAAKVVLILAARDAGLGPRGLAAELGCDPKEAQRLLDPDHATRIERLTEAIRALRGPWLQVSLCRPDVLAEQS